MLMNLRFPRGKRKILRHKKGTVLKPCLLYIHAKTFQLSPLTFYLKLVTVVFRFKRTFNSYANIIGLVLVKYFQFNANFGKVQAGNFFVKVFW